MFSICHKCTRLVTLNRFLNNSCLRSVSLNRNLPENPQISDHLNNFIFTRTCFRKKFSSVSNSDEGENNNVTTEEIDYKLIANGDEEIEHKLKVMALETEVMRQEGYMVPPNSYFTHDHWRELVNLPTRTARKRFLEYLFKLSKKKENRQLKKEEKKLQREEWKQSKQEEDQKEETFEEFVSKYDLQHNNLFLRVYDTTMNNLYNNRLIKAIMFGQKLVVDCGYVEDMTKRENSNCAKQLMLLFAENRAHDDPFDLHLCNAKPESILIKQLNKHIPGMYDPAFPLNVHEKSYLDVFPKDKLVYLTPHCREELTEYDHDAVYIVGGIVDKVNNQPLSLAKAKREGLKMAKLPLDKYLLWGSGSGKSLTLNQVVSILNDVKLTKKWEFALRHVPKRKVVDFSVGKNINTSNTLRFDRSNRERKWTPSSNVNFDGLKYSNKNKSGEKERIVKIKSIMND